MFTVLPRRSLGLAAVLLLAAPLGHHHAAAETGKRPLATEFRDDFDGPSLPKDPNARAGWASFSGDGAAVIDFQQRRGHASILVDATRDRRNVWWAVIRRYVSENLDLTQLSQPGKELRIEARIRVSHAPRRVNLHLQTQRTTDFHSHLMEFDIPDTTNWHTISMTTRDFEVLPGDMVFGQLALMDWGLGKYTVDVDSFSVSIVDAKTAGPDKGVQTPYQPPLPPLKSLAHTVAAAQAGMVDSANPEVTFTDWTAATEKTSEPVLTASGSQDVILRWDLSKLAGKRVAGLGVLELTTHSLLRHAKERKDFGQIRVVEILGGDPAWDASTVTYDSLRQGRPAEEVFNSQMVIDTKIVPGRGRKTLIAISRPVLQRLLDGKTRGLALHALGAISASFMPGASRDSAPKLRFNTEP